MDDTLYDYQKGPPLSGASVDVILLGVVIALHVTRRNENLKLILVMLLVVHVAATTQRFRPVAPAASAPCSLGSGIN